MYIQKSVSGITNTAVKWIKKIMISMGVIFLIILGLSGNKLLVTQNYTFFVDKVRSRLVGNEDVSVSSISDILFFSKSAFYGLITPNRYPSLEITLPQVDTLLMSKDLNGARYDEPDFRVDINLSADSENQYMEAKIRLKGDREIHRESSKDLSYRINLSGTDRFRGMEKFSIQRPIVRNYTWEYLIADIFAKEKLLTLQQGPINLRVNGDNRGIFSYEEVPSVSTIERQKRKSGPIFGLEEDLGVGIDAMLDVYEAKSWIDDPIYNIAKALLYEQFRAAELDIAFSEDVFDFNEWARFFALHDVFGSYHGTVMKSVKYYYNPVNGKFQPLLFDAHKGAGSFDDFVLLDFLLSPNTRKCLWICDQDKFYMGFLRNPKFVKLYVESLSRYSSPEFLSSVFESYDTNFRNIDNKFYSNFSASDAIHSRGFGFYLFKLDTLFERSTIVTNRLQKFSDKRVFDRLSEGLGNDIETAVIKGVNSDLDILFLESFSLTAESWTFSRPTVIIISGSSSLSGTKNLPLQIHGPVMLVQTGGNLEINRVVFNNPKSFQVQGRNWSGAVNSLDSKIILTDVTIINADAEDALNIVNSEFKINNLKINNAMSDAVDLDFSNGVIDSIYCNDIGNDCLDTSGSDVRVNLIEAWRVSDKVVSVGERSNVVIQKVEVNNVAIGLVSKDESSLQVIEYVGNEVELDYAVFNKKEEYLPPSFSLKLANSVSGYINGLSDSNAVISLPTNVVNRPLSSVEIEKLMYGAVYGVATENR